MRTLIILLCFSVSLISCNDSQKESETPSKPNQTIEPKNDLRTAAQDQPIDQKDNNFRKENKSSNVHDEESNTSASAPISGVYLNSQHQEDTACNCYCIEISLDGSSKLCLKDDMHINARFQENGNNIDIYYSGKSSGSVDGEIPWEKFETGTPIATLNPQPNGDLKLDWKGFSINGEIAIDYALLGKKTLEGTYKKK